MSVTENFYREEKKDLEWRTPPNLSMITAGIRARVPWWDGTQYREGTVESRKWSTKYGAIILLDPPEKQSRLTVSRKDQLQILLPVRKGKK